MEKKKMTIWDLKYILKDVLKNLDDYSDETVVDVQPNTYWLYGEYISLPSVWFVDLTDPVEENDEWYDYSDDFEEK